MDAIKQRSFIQRGLALVDGSRCPLCDMEWEDEEHLKNHLQTKIAKSAQAEALQKRVLENAAAMGSHARRIATLVGAVLPVAGTDGPAGFAEGFSAWGEHLTAFAKSMGTVEGVLGHKAHFEQGWIATPPSLAAKLETLAATVKAKPDQSASVAAHSFLALAQDRIETCRQVRRAEKRAQEAAQVGKIVYDTYCKVAEDRLSALYDAVEGDFSDFYREINGEDERAFKAKFEPTEGKLDLAVAFYDKGMYPPGAYHSEGHQDGMGVCLYLALMKRLLGDRFRFAVLDDVVMSVDRITGSSSVDSSRTVFLVPSSSSPLTTRSGPSRCKPKASLNPKAELPFTAGAFRPVPSSRRLRRSGTRSKWTSARTMLRRRPSGCGGILNTLPANWPTILALSRLTAEISRMISATSCLR